MASLVGAVLVGLCYLLPTVIAELRRHHQRGAIAVVNILLGWTVIGWVVALAMACSAVRRGQGER
jgi:hypothetical protein